MTFEDFVFSSHRNASMKKPPICLWILAIWSGLSAVNGGLLSEIWGGITRIIKSIVWVDVECEKDAFVCPDKSLSYRNASDKCAFKPCPIASLKNDSVDLRSDSVALRDGEAIQNRAEGRTDASEWFMNAEFVVPVIRYQDVFNGKMVAVHLTVLLQRKQRMQNVTVLDIYTFPPALTSLGQKMDVKSLGNDGNWGAAERIVRTQVSRYRFYSSLLSVKSLTKENIQYTIESLCDELDREPSQCAQRLVSAVPVDRTHTPHSLREWWRLQREARVEIMEVFHTLYAHSEAFIWITPIDFVLTRILDTLHDTSYWRFRDQDEMIQRLRLSIWIAHQLPCKLHAFSDRFHYTHNVSEHQKVATDQTSTICCCWKLHSLLEKTEKDEITLQICTLNGTRHSN